MLIWIQGFKDSRIQINLFATTNTFCYGINKQDIQYNYKQGWGQIQLTKYSNTPSTPTIYQVQVLVKYSFF